MHFASMSLSPVKCETRHVILLPAQKARTPIWAERSAGGAFEQLCKDFRFVDIFRIRWLCNLLDFNGQKNLLLLDKKLHPLKVPQDVVEFRESSEISCFLNNSIPQWFLEFLPV